jgi:hypothetical protein
MDADLDEDVDADEDKAWSSMNRATSPKYNSHQTNIPALVSTKLKTGRSLP